MTSRKRQVGARVRAAAAGKPLAPTADGPAARNPGIPLDLGWVREVRVNRSAVERRENMKCTWVSNGRERDWLEPAQGWGEECLRQATQVKNVWVPYGE